MEGLTVADTGKLDLRYVTERRNASGKIRRYWQRKGHKVTRLPNGPEWAARATELNQDADTKPEGSTAVMVPETIAWAIRAYRETDEFKEKAESTREAYEPWLKRYESMWGVIRCRGITRKVIVDFLDGDEFKRPVDVAGKTVLQFKRPTRILAAAVLRNILNVAHNKGVIDDNPCGKLGLSRNKPRQALWTEKDLAAFEREAENHAEGAAAVRYNMLLLYTGQRPIDVQAMKRGHQQDGLIKVTQQKTGAIVWIPEHRELTAELAKPGNSLHYLIARSDGTPISYGTLDKLCRAIRRAAGLGHLQQRDLRRTAVVRLAEAGCTVPEIAAITGHTIEETTKILETYLPRTLPMARAAILKWEQKETSKP